MNKLVVITSVSMANGYRLAGNEAYGVANVKEATELVRKFIDNCEPVLLAIDDELFSQMDRKLIKEVYDCKHLALVTIPGKTTKTDNRLSQKYFYNMIRHATGVQIHFKGESNGSSK
ncbi:MAG: hypothetical protein GYA52_02460 [Chloroflexi bacterium]|jgi:V/A-type H+-transporting ATPase subunit F|nr:hypothetical protein [Chloroflexota bacterium]